MSISYIIGILLCAITIISFSTAGCIRGHLLEKKRFTSLLIGLIISVVLSLVAIPTFFLVEGFIPEELETPLKELAKAYGLPVIFVILNILLILFTYLFYLIPKSKAKKGEDSSQVLNPTVKSRLLGLLIGLGCSLILAGGIFFSAYKFNGLENDYKKYKKDIKSIEKYADGKSHDNEKVYKSVKRLIDYFFDFKALSDESKVDLLNYGIDIANNTIRNKLSIDADLLSKYKKLRDHKKQIETLGKCAEILESSGTISLIMDDRYYGEKLTSAILSDNNYILSIIRALSLLDNGGNVFAKLYNPCIYRMTDGVIPDKILNETSLNLSSYYPEDVLILLARFTDHNLEYRNYSLMNNNGKESLINELESLSSYDLFNSNSLKILINEIEATKR